MPPTASGSLLCSGRGACLSAARPGRRSPRRDRRRGWRPPMPRRGPTVHHRPRAPGPAVPDTGAPALRALRRPPGATAGRDARSIGRRRRLCLDTACAHCATTVARRCRSSPTVALSGRGGGRRERCAPRDSRGRGREHHRRRRPGRVGAAASSSATSPTVTPRPTATPEPSASLTPAPTTSSTPSLEQTAVPTPSPAAPVTYTVVAGDSLVDIADRFGIDGGRAPGGQRHRRPGAAADRPGARHPVTAGRAVTSAAGTSGRTSSPRARRSDAALAHSADTARLRGDGPSGTLDAASRSRAGRAREA